jgi:hypothetical protein
MNLQKIKASQKILKKKSQSSFFRHFEFVEKKIVLQKLYFGHKFNNFFKELLFLKILTEKNVFAAILDQPPF